MRSRLRTGNVVMTSLWLRSPELLQPSAALAATKAQYEDTREHRLQMILKMKCRRPILVEAVFRLLKLRSGSRESVNVQTTETLQRSNQTYQLTAST